MSVLQTILVFVVPTVGLYLIIAFLAVAPRLARRPRYRVGQPWTFAPLWWTANPEGAQLAAVISHPVSGERGGAVAAGEHGSEIAVVDPADLPTGAVVTSSGRVSAAEVYKDPTHADHPFSPVQLSRLDEALTMASRETGLRFSVYLGDLGQDVTARAAELHGELEGTTEAVLVAVSPEQRVVEVVTGPEARLRLPDRGSKLAVMSMIASFKESDMLGGLLSGLRMLADQAGGRRRLH